ncbi:MAG TPA: hypothetical protein VGI20_06415 [Rhizomicrobium sp.]|jgi:hypothetical protein
MLNRFLRDRGGNIAIIAAVTMTATAGMAGLVAEYGDGLFNRIEDQRSADVAALAGANNYAANNSVSAMTDTVSRSATLNGLSGSAAVASIVSSPTGDGNQAVKVIVSSSVPLMFSRFVSSRSSLPVQAAAYAEIKPSSMDCILALDATAQEAIKIGGNADVQAPHCNVVSDSANSDAFDVGNSAQLTTSCAIAVGGISGGSGLQETVCTNPDTPAASTPDPYASLPVPTSVGSGPCVTIPKSLVTYSPGHYCSGISISGAATFSSGIYYIDGGFSLQGGSTVTGTDVMFYITKNGTFSMSGSATVTLSAPTSGTYAGILFFGDRSASNSSDNKINGSNSSTLTGVLYFPTQQITYSGNSGAATTCTQLIGDTITFTGSTTVSNSCSGTGVNPFSTPGMNYASLVQ